MEDYRPRQADIIAAVMNNEDCFVIMPTGRSSLVFAFVERSVFGAGVGRFFAVPNDEWTNVVDYRRGQITVLCVARNHDARGDSGDIAADIAD